MLRAHPRSRGENATPTFSQKADAGSSPLTRGKLDVHVSISFVEGSSPLTRGKRLHERCAEPYLGLIPAHAGKTPRHP